MSEEAFLQRTTTCGALRACDEGKSVVLNGWADGYTATGITVHFTL